MLLTMSQMDKWQVKIGPKLADVLPYAELDTDDVRNDVQKMGVLSAFHGAKSYLDVRVAVYSSRIHAAWLTSLST